MTTVISLIRRRTRKARESVRNAIVRRPVVTFAVSLITLCTVYAVFITLIPLPPRYLAMLDSVIGGLVASLAAYTAVQYLINQTQSQSTRRWLSFGHRTVWITTTTIVHASDERYRSAHYRVVPPFDAMSASFLSELARRAGYRYPMRRIVGSHTDRPAIFRDNIITMCLPSRNQYSRLFLGLLYEKYIERTPSEILLKEDCWKKYLDDEQCKLKYLGVKCEWNEERAQGFKEWKILDPSETEPNKWKRSDINYYGFEAATSPEKHFADFSMIVKAPNPLNPDASVIVVCGIHGIGTFGGALYLLQNAGDLEFDHGAVPQAHLLEVTYVIPDRKLSYLDAEIVPPIRLKSSRYFDSD